MKCYKLTQTQRNFEEGRVTVYGIGTVQDISSDREFVESLLEKINRLGVEEELLLETVEEAVAEHFTL